MKDRSGIKVIVVLAAIAAAVFFSITPLANKINLGLDLQGGAQVVMQAIPEEGKTITSEDMASLTAVMRNRVDQFGVSEPIIQTEGNDRLIIELAGVEDPEKAIELLGRTAKLEFKDPSGNVIVDGSELKTAKAQINTSDSTIEIDLEFTDEGAKKFGTATARLVGQPIGIYLEDQIIQEPTVDEPIMNGQARISGGFATLEEASEIASLLRGGALPVDIEILSKTTVGPTLGQDSLDKSMKAALLGIIILFIFLIAYYRLPGAWANISLFVYTLILLWALVLINATLTLAGIAGFVLSMGMAVDANIIIYERVKEELRWGKSLKASIDSGFKRAFITIIDSNLTTIIAAAVLYGFGTGSIKGFAITLIIGLMASMFTAIVFTRQMLFWMSDIDFLSNKKLYGGIGGETKNG